MTSSESSDEEVITSSKGKASTSSRQRLASESSDRESEDETPKDGSRSSPEDEESNQPDPGEKSNPTPEEGASKAPSPESESSDSSIDSEDNDEAPRKSLLMDSESDQESGSKTKTKTKTKTKEKAKTKEKKKPPPRKRLPSESSDDDDSDKEAAPKASEEPSGSSDSSSGDEGEDEDEEDDEEGAGQDKEQSKSPRKVNSSPSTDDESEDETKASAPNNGMIYDFDIMMAKKKEENSRKRRRRGYDIINDSDDMIADIINQMRDAVESDIEANKNKQVATSKLKLLPFLINQLRKVDLRDAFLDSDVLSVIAEWLAPLPDRSLPHLNIRENLLKILIDFNLLDVDRIKGSGIGKAVMYLYKHPKETKENKERAKHLISAWSRPIFNLDSSFSAISREERQERDKELQRRASRGMVDSSDGEGGPGPAPKRNREDAAQPVAKNPGDKGWIPRARVPAPSMRDYVIRPRSKIDGDIGKASKRPANMLEKLMKTHQERRRASKQQRAVNMKIDKC